MLGLAQNQEQAHSREEEEKDGSYQGQLRRLLGKQEKAAARTWNVLATKHPELGSWSLVASQFRSYQLSVERAVVAERCQNEQVTFELRQFI